MLRTFRTVAALVAVALVVLCGDTRAQSHRVIERRNIDYVPQAEYRDGKDRLDLYMPDGVTDAPVIVSLHGGVLMAGDRSEERAVGQRLASAGYLTVIPSYRLSPEVSHPAHIQDVAAAFAWTRRNIRQYGGDPDRIIVIGHSAGAYLAMLLAADPRYLAAHQLSPRDIKGVVPVSGFFWVDKAGVAPDRPAEIWGTNPKTWVDASPAHYLRADFPPVLLIDTDGDEDWRQQQNADFYAALRAAGDRDVAIHHVPGRTHMSVWYDMSKGPKEETSSTILQFAARVLTVTPH
jgi:acetyl esterase/lipase